MHLRIKLSGASGSLEGKNSIGGTDRLERWWPRELHEHEVHQVQVQGPAPELKSVLIQNGGWTD